MTLSFKIDSSIQNNTLSLSIVTHLNFSLPVLYLESSYLTVYFISHCPHLGIQLLHFIRGSWLTWNLYFYSHSEILSSIVCESKPEASYTQDILMWLFLFNVHSSLYLAIILFCHYGWKTYSSVLIPTNYVSFSSPSFLSCPFFFFILSVISLSLTNTSTFSLYLAFCLILFFFHFSYHSIKSVLYGWWWLL